MDPEEKTRVQKWKSEMPSSIFANFVGIRFQYADAWNTRGSDYASEVSDGAFKKFTTGLAETEASLMAAPLALKNTQIWHHLLLAVVQDSPGTKQDAEKVFAEGVNRWPDYFDFYDVALSHKVPRWGGSWAEVEAFVDYWSKKRLATEGKSFYIRLYATLFLQTQQWPAQGHDIDVKRIEESLDDLVARYPDLYNFNLRASIACGTLKDRDYVIKSIKAVGEKDVRVDLWMRGYTIQNCANYFRENWP